MADSYTYTDAEQILASELVYLDFDGLENQSLGSIVKEIEDAYRKTQYPDNKLQNQMKFVEDIKERANRNGVENWDKWIIKKVCNDNSVGKSGYYGVMIDTGNGKAIVASRGSETTAKQLVPDWISNDLSFMDGDGTSQEVVATRFAEEIWYKYGKEYDSFTITGHSLGGHLALHMAISAPVAMKDKIDKAISFDGPGFSDEYIKHHRTDIDKMANKLTHYKYSLVGGLLSPLPGVGTTIITSSENGIWDVFKRHSLWTIELDDKGKVIIGGERIESVVMGEISRIIDSIDYGDWAVISALFAIAPMAVVPVFMMESAVILIKSVVEVYGMAKDTVEKVGKWIEDVKYNHFKPQVSGDFEIHTATIESVIQELAKELRIALALDEEARVIIDSMRSTWTSCAYLRSKIRSNIRAIKHDIERLTILVNIMSEARTIYSNTDSEVSASFMQI